MSVNLVVLACKSLHVCTVCIWRCEHARFCAEVFYALYINFHLFIHSLVKVFNGFLQWANAPKQQWDMKEYIIIKPLAQPSQLCIITSFDVR